MEDCVYLKSHINTLPPEDGRAVHICDIHSQCTTTGIASPYASCEGCPDRLLISRKSFSSLFLDHLTILDRTRTRTHALRNLLAGKSTFLVGGGPSAKVLPLEQLHQRGVWSLGINNMAGFAKTNAFICADPPSKFHHGIWLDPRVMKFVPIPKLSGRRTNLRKKKPEGDFEELKIDGKRIGVTECPNVWGFSRRSWLQTDDTFFTDHGAAWGNHNEGVKRTGLEKTVMTMLLAIRVLYYLGSRRIYLVGVDFQMDPTIGLHDNYAFGQKRNESAINSNNSQYLVVNDWLSTMQTNGTFSRFGLEVFNCYQRSGLRAFEFVPFDLAIQEVLREFPKEPFDLDGWYEKS